jgi:membrane complex biogenesis BtpA family protein
MHLLHPAWANVPKIVIGMLHLRALPGAPLYDGNIEKVRESMLRDAEALVEGGVHGLMMENFFDTPFFPDRVPAQVVAQMTALAVAVRSRFEKVPLGINVLRNDGRSALAVAQASGASFIRVNVLCGARVADQGILHGIAHELLRDRAALRARDIKIFADVDVKHSAALAPRAIEDEVEDTLKRGLADALIVSGAGTGKATDPAHVAAVKQRAGDAPVFVGSGITAETIDRYLAHADGFIVGTAFKHGGIAANPVDVTRVRELLKPF